MQPPSLELGLELLICPCLNDRLLIAYFLDVFSTYNRHLTLSSSNIAPTDMNHRVLDLTPAAAHLLVFDQQADFMEELGAFGERRSVQSATFQGIGAFSSATLAFFDREAQRYDPIEVATQTEVLHVSGNLTRHEGEIRVHAHATLSYPDGSTIGGHLLQATVWPTLELQCQTYSTRIGRTDHEDIGLPLIPQSSPAQ